MSTKLFRGLTSIAGALALSSLLVAPYEFADVARSVATATQASSVGWISAVRAGGSGARAEDFAVVRLGRQG